MSVRDGAEDTILETAGEKAAAKEVERRSSMQMMLNISLNRKMYVWGTGTRKSCN